MDPAEETENVERLESELEDARQRQEQAQADQARREEIDEQISDLEKEKENVGT